MSTIGETGEFGLIDRLVPYFTASREVLVGIGDDCAVVRVGGETLLLTTDMVIEGRHFLREHFDGEAVGWKAAAGALSDIAAMGGTPLFVLASFAAPADTATAFAEGVARGMAALAAEYGATVVGGDTTRCDTCVALDLAVVGRVEGDRYVTRKGAQRNDRLLVTGPLGRAAAGLHALKHGEGESILIEAQLRPRPRIAEGQWLAQQEGVRAMVDISDGLAQDAGHLAKAAGIGVDIALDGLPAADPLLDYCRQADLDADAFRLSGGEDYELAVAVDPDRAPRIVDDFRAAFAKECYIVGQFSDNWHGVHLNGETIERGGFDHFKE